MWINSETSLPDPLLSSQRDGRLVVFAGAGVSMGPPSNLPDFKDLALQLAGAGITLDKDEPYDRFLGRVENRGTNLQVRARAVLDDPRSLPRSLHRSICKLFRSPPDIRLITTNFDRHFTRALRQEYGGEVPIYHAPALPLGHEFSGLVYLHGAVEHLRHRLILSDADFGRAYLTEGWATRFLHDVFRTYTVLFIGYSHSDPVIRYIARALSPSDCPRFALIPEGDDGQWGYYGIEPVRYPLRDSGAKHAALDQCMEDWVRLSRMGVLDHEHRVNELVAKGPPLAREDIDYLESICREPATLRFFVSVAQGREWLEWMAQRRFLEPLFSPEARLTECERILAGWLVQRYGLNLPQPLFDLILAHDGRLNLELWFELTRVLAFNKPRPSRELLAQCLVILIPAAHPGWNHRCLADLLRFCTTPEDYVIALLLLEHLATPHPRLVQPWSLEEDDGKAQIRVELHALGDAHELQDAWQGYFRKHLDILHQRLAPMLTGMLHSAHGLLRASGEGREEWDGTSLTRSAIEPHAQDRVLHDMDVVINAARDLVEWLLLNRRELGVALRAQWLDSATPLVRRLGIHALTADPELPADESIGLILARKWLYTFPAKHEVFQLLKARYGQAGEETRRRVLAATENEAEPGEDEDARQTSAYERFNLVLWLAEAAPDCPFTQAEFRKVKELHPEFVRREYPDLSSWGGEVRSVIPQSPITIEAMLERAPAELAFWLAEYQPEQRFEGPDRHGLLVTVQESAGKNFGWTIDLMGALAAQGIWKKDLWDALLEGLASTGHSRPEWEQVVTTLDAQAEVMTQSGRSVLSVIEKLVEEKAESLDLALLLRAMNLARASAGEGEHPDTVFSRDRKDWLGRAINHIGGRAALATIKGLSKLREVSGESWAGIPAKTKTWFEAISRDPRIDAARARTVLASQFHFFFGLDRVWTTEVLLPLFSWDRDPETAEQAWHGYLGWGRWNDAILEALRPSLEAAFGRIESSLAELRDEFAKLLAGIALYSSTDPWHGDGWLVKYVRDTDAASLRSWAWAMDHALKELKPEQVKLVWERWMKEYLTARSTGVPRPFVPEELGAMLEWVHGLRVVAPEFVALVCRQPVQLPERSMFLYGLKESPLIGEYPGPMAQLLDHLFRTSSTLHYECGSAVEVTKKIRAAGVDQGVLKTLAESLVRLGCGEAAQLRDEFGF